MEADLTPLASEKEEVTKGVELAAADSENTVDAQDNFETCTVTETSTVATTTATSVAAENAPTEGAAPEMATSGEPQNIEAIPAPAVETNMNHAAPSTVVVQTAAAPTGSKQLQQQEFLQQNLNMAKDWAASDIEKKLAENRALLSQWSLILDKNGSFHVLDDRDNFDFLCLCIINDRAIKCCVGDQRDNGCIIQYHARRTYSKLTVKISQKTRPVS